MSKNEYVINGIHTYGESGLKVQVAEEGLSLSTTIDTLENNFEMNGYGFLYNGQGASWSDVRQKVVDLKAVVAPPEITTLQVNNKINITDGTNTVGMTSTNVTAGGTTTSWATILAGGGGSQNLQQVLNTGDTANRGMTLTFGTKTANINGGLFQTLSPDGSNIRVEPNEIILYDTNTDITTNIKTNYVASSGGLYKTWADILSSSTTPTLQQVIDAGNSATSSVMNFTNGDDKASYNGTQSSFESTSSIEPYWAILDRTGLTAMNYDNLNRMELRNNSLTFTTFGGTTPTTITQTDVLSGGITKSWADILSGGGATPTLQSVLTTGNTATTSIILSGGATFQGNLTGNSDTATTATNITASSTGANQSYYPLFSTVLNGQSLPQTHTNFNFNPNSGALTTTSFVGALTGNANTATTSNISLASAITDTNDSTTFYIPMFSGAIPIGTTQNKPLFCDTTTGPLSYVASQSALTVALLSLTTSAGAVSYNNTTGLLQITTLSVTYQDFNWTIPAAQTTVNLTAFAISIKRNNATNRIYIINNSPNAFTIPTSVGGNGTQTNRVSWTSIQTIGPGSSWILTATNGGSNGGNYVFLDLKQFF